MHLASEDFRYTPPGLARYKSMNMYLPRQLASLSAALIYSERLPVSYRNSSGNCQH